MENLKTLEVLRKVVAQYPDPSPALRADIIRQMFDLLENQERRITALESDSSRRMQDELK